MPELTIRSPDPVLRSGLPIRSPTWRFAVARARRRLWITGVVQGVGFRPFVFGLATRMGISGWVCNTSSGVEAEVEGPKDVLDAFVHALPLETPPLARIDRLSVSEIEPVGEQGFHIRRSVAVEGAFQPVSPDVATCDECLAEVLDERDRRHHYPFTNCTNCGPRFTIILDLPYDRPHTTMAAFTMCAECQAEYDDPTNRRFHAQPNACPRCGPHAWLEVAGVTVAEREEAIAATRQRLAKGEIVALKGLGGFHLACDATLDAPVHELRRRKGRVEKPFAVMAPDADTVARFCELSAKERALLESPERPIVLLRRRPGPGISEEVAPANRHLGFILPYTPLHRLLVEPSAGQPLALVMTSGNVSEEPIVTGNELARRRLAGLADSILLHDRRIHARCDDSVVRVHRGRELPIRRARGYAPYPVRLPFESPPLIACGGELKNTFCVTRRDYAFLSPHIGDLENFETLASFETMLEHFKDLFRVQPEAVAYDLHPGYLATKYAQGPRCTGLRRIGVQHHHAHIASCMAEHRLAEDEAVIGLSFDGTGYGTDGAIWGGEVLVCAYAAFRRAGHLAPVVLPGSEAAIRAPLRMALAWLHRADVDWDSALPPVAASSEQERKVVAAQLAGRLPSPVTTSLGRLFDAVSSLAGVRHRITYEAQAAMELEAALDEDESGAYEFALDSGPRAVDATTIIDPCPAIRQMAADVREGVPASVISARFHNAVANAAAAVCSRIRAAGGPNAVCLSGGVFQNIALLERTVGALEALGFRVYWHRKVPPNDGGLALGQAVVGAARMRRDAAPGGPPAAQARVDLAPHRAPRKEVT